MNESMDGWVGLWVDGSSFLACNSRLRSAMRRHHPPQRAVLSQICCFGERKMDGWVDGIINEKSRDLLSTQNTFVFTENEAFTDECHELSGELLVGVVSEELIEQ